LCAERARDGRAAARLHRTYLYAPGSQERVIGKALEAGADAVVLDLEDAVAPADKAAARRTVAAALAEEQPCDVHVRINREDDRWSTEDLRAVVRPGLAALRLPKADAPDAVRALDDALAELERAAGLPEKAIALYPTVESAAGALAAHSVLTASPRVARPAFGASDFLADIGARGDEDLGTLHARSALVLAARGAGAGPPIDSVHTALDDEDGLRRAAERARSLGFFGKSIIHPRQIETVHAVFTPTREEIDRAERTVAAADAAAASTVDGEFVDAAVAARARAVLALKEASGGQG
jgi:citrate lyase subunit beta / citryl-CoA lyase